MDRSLDKIRANNDFALRKPLPPSKCLEEVSVKKSIFDEVYLDEKILVVKSW